MHPRPCIHYLATYLSVRCSGKALWANSFMVGCWQWLAGSVPFYPLKATIMVALEAGTYRLL